MSPKASRGGAPAGSKMNPTDAARIQSTQAKAGNDTSKGSFPARAQSSAAKNTAGSPPSSKASGKGPKA